MIKFILFFFVFTFNIIYSQNQYSKIDSIKTEKDAEDLILSFGEDYKNFKIKKIADFKEKYGANKHCKKLSDSFNIDNSFYKSDFDKNGLTDILIIGDYYDFNIFVVMNFGSDNLKLNRLTRDSFQECTFPIVNVDSSIDYYFMSQPSLFSNEKQKLVKKKLIYKYDNFIESNSQEKKYNIEKIEYRATLCYGTCPDFYLAIDQKGVGTLNAKSYNFNPKTKNELKGNFNSQIDNESLNKIFDLVNYLDFPNLEDNYSVNVTDNPTSYLTITYNNGKKKQIKDYGQRGTFGLFQLYKMISELRFNQDWK